MLYHQLDTVWGIPHRCLDQTHASILRDCLVSIRRYYPNHRIIVVDSDSPYKEHLPALSEEFQVTIAPMVNKHYEAGAWKMVYQHCYSDFYCFMHDSCRLLAPITDVFDLDVATYRCVPEWTGANNDIITATQKSLEDTKWSVSGFFWTLVGTIVLAKGTVIQALYRDGFFDLLPTNKFESECWERRIGICLCQDGHTKSLATNQLGIRGPRLAKEYYCRS